MHFPSLVPLLIVLLLAFLLFGRPGRLSSIMEDLGKGIRGFRKGMDDQAKAQDDDPKRVGDQSGAASSNSQTSNSNGDRASN